MGVRKNMIDYHKLPNKIKKFVINNEQLLKDKINLYHNTDSIDKYFGRFKITEKEIFDFIFDEENLNTIKLNSDLENINTFNDELPSVVYWDASFFLAIFREISFNKLQKDVSLDCMNFAKRLIQNDVINLISHFSFDHIYQGIFLPILKKRYKEKGIRGDWYKIALENPKIALEEDDIAIYEDLLEFFNNIPILILDFSPSVYSTSLNIMKKYNLYTYPAYNIASAIENDIRSIVTTNLNYAKIDEINIYTSKLLL